MNKMNNLKQEAEVVRILKHAKALIADKEHWLQEAFATNAEGRNTSPWNADAVNFCAVGANRKAAGMEHSEGSRKYLAIACKLMTFGEYSNIAEFNDRSTHEEVMELFDVAILWATYATELGMET